ncbi:DEAD/DEAH box helicase [Loigolactobacillus backii]|uniref:DEAD/DEAH box helicase n=1 Tax=Loigolactobacillus backii TaxID=375175 RepID=UPI0007F134A0|nr:DEAD/DEAH box helicase [Loigolactobacillus backii]ANK60051.1 DEAD/DEAH box helicase [Loigolactobacillus backii]
MKILHDYQLETIQKITESIHNGHHSIIVQQPPRTGKTVIMAEIARRATAKGNRILFIVHRKELVDQARETFIDQGVNINLAQIGMVQTITRHVADLKQPSIIFIDEAHHSLAKSYQRILTAFPKAIKLLFTATPWRMSGEGFETVADKLMVGKSIDWLIKQGYLAPIDYYAPKQIDTSKLKLKSTGEFTDKSIEQAIKPKIYGNAVKTYLKLAKCKQAIAYTYNVESAKKLAKAFCEAGVKAKAVSGKTPKNKRDQIIKAYRNGEIDIVTNAELFTEGLDLPNVDCVIMLRPTKSLSLFLQFSMRAMNPRKGKTAIIIDHVGNVERFGLPTAERQWSLTGSDKKTRQKQAGAMIKGVTVCENCFATFYRTGDTCPFCGASLTEEMQLDVDEKAELVKIAAKHRVELAKRIMSDVVTQNVAGKAPAELKSMKEIIAYGKIHDYKPGWAFFYGKKRGLLK